MSKGQEMKVKLPLKYKIFATVFFIQFVVIFVFILSFVKSFKEDKLTSAKELNATTISEIKAKFESKIFLMVEKIKSTTGLLEKNQLTKENLVNALDLAQDKSVEALFHYEIKSGESTLSPVEQFAKFQIPSMNDYFGNIYQKSFTQFPYFWNFNWQKVDYVGMAFSLNYNIEINGIAQAKKHVYFILFNQNELFQMKNKNQLAETVVFTKNGQIIYSKTLLTESDLQTAFQLNLKNAVSKGLIQVSEQKIQQKNYLVSTQAQSFGDLIIATFISTEDAFSGVKKVYENATYLTLFSILFSYLFTLFFSGTITKPLTYLTQQMQKISKGELDVVVDIKSKDEVGVLALNFNQMTLDLKSSKEALETLNKDLESKVAERTKQLEELTIKDALTGAYNRRYFDQRLLEEIQRSKRSGTSVGLLYLDIDHFKKYNDQNGHPEGDQLLINFVKTVKDIVRTSDYFCRLGGEEFCIVTVGATVEGVKVLAEKVRNGIFSKDFKHGEKQPLGRLSCSIGLSLYPEFASDPDSLVKSADEALYHAKQGGRNRWMMAEKPITKAVDEVFEKLNKNKAS